MDSIKMRDGYEIHYSYDKAEQARAIVFINYGFAEHMGRYDYLSAAFRMRGFDVLRYDLRGHGSNADLGYLADFNDFVQDSEEMMKHISDKTSKLPIFMLGHSMGGLITALHGIRKPSGVRGQILSGPAVGRLPASEGKSKGLFKFLSTAAGRMQIKNPIDEGLCGDSQVIRDYIADPMVLKKASISMYYQFLFEAVDSLNDIMEAYTYPCLICHGENDPIVPVELSKSFMERISSEDKTHMVYEGLYHEILNEKIKDQVIADMVEWMDARI